MAIIFFHRVSGEFEFSWKTHFSEIRERRLVQGCDYVVGELKRRNRAGRIVSETDGASDVGRSVARSGDGEKGVRVVFVERDRGRQRGEDGTRSDRPSGQSARERVATTSDAVVTSGSEWKHCCRELRRQRNQERWVVHSGSSPRGREPAEEVAGDADGRHDGVIGIVGLILNRGDRPRNDGRSHLRRELDVAQRGLVLGGKSQSVASIRQRRLRNLHRSERCILGNASLITKCRRSGRSGHFEKMWFVCRGVFLIRHFSGNIH